MEERGWKIDPETGMCSVSKGYLFYTLMYWFIHLPVEDRRKIWKLREIYPTDKMIELTSK